MTTTALPDRQKTAMDNLYAMLQPGDTVYTIVRHVAASGMSRTIAPLLARDGEVIDITWMVCAALPGIVRFDQARGGCIIRGCGMDMAFELVYNLAAAMWPHGNGAYVTGRNGSVEPETDGGFMLRQRGL